MLRFLFRRSREVERTDDALRRAGIHPKLVTDAVKLALLRLLGEDRADERALARAAEMLVFCIEGREGFAAANDEALAAAVEGRLEAAMAAGDSRDAQVVLLALHARVADPGTVERYGLEIG